MEPPATREDDMTSEIKSLSGDLHKRLLVEAGVTVHVAEINVPMRRVEIKWSFPAESGRRMVTVLWTGRRTVVDVSRISVRPGMFRDYSCVEPMWDTPDRHDDPVSAVREAVGYMIDNHECPRLGQSAAHALIESVVGPAMRRISP
jgi:hypothetical protein